MTHFEANEPNETPGLVEVGPTTKLPIEKQFQIVSFNSQVDRMSPQQAYDMLKDLHKQMIYREEAFKQIMARQWELI